MSVATIEATAPTANRSRTLHGVQVLRFVAAALVVFAHIGGRASIHDHRFYNGWIGISGVDIFFVISGYIMARLLDPMPSGASAAFRFFRRRLIRIAPIYWLVSLGVLLFWYFTGNELASRLNEFHRPYDIVKSFLFTWPTILAVGWTLTYEMRLYVILTVALLFKLRSRPRIALAAVLLLGYGLVLILRGPEHASEWRRAGMFAEFILGILVFYLTNTRQFSKWLGLSAVMVGLALFAATAARSNGDIFWMSASSALVFGFVALERTVPWPPLAVKLGDASYSLYLCHMYVLLALEHLVWQVLGAPDNDLTTCLLFGIVGMAAACAFSLVMYRYIERPMTDYLHRRWG